MTDLNFKANNTAGAKERINSSVSEVLDPYTDLDLPSAGESATINDITKAELIDALNKVVSANSNGFTTDTTYGSIGNSGELAVVQAALQMLEANPGAIDGAIGNMTRTAYETFKTNYNAGRYTGGSVPAVQLTQGLSSPEAISAMVVALGGTPAAVVEGAAAPDPARLASVDGLSNDQKQQVKDQAKERYDAIRTRLANGVDPSERAAALAEFDELGAARSFRRMQGQELDSDRLTRTNRCSID